MAYITNNLLPDRDVYDVDVIEGLDVNSQQFKDFLVRLYQITNDIKISVNSRDGGFWPLGEFNTGMQYYPNPADPTATPRTINRCVVNFGALPNNATKVVNHNINAGIGTTTNYFFIGHSAWANDTTNLIYFPIPSVSPTTGNNVFLSVGQTQVAITTNFNATAFTTDVTL